MTSLLLLALAARPALAQAPPPASDCSARSSTGDVAAALELAEAAYADADLPALLAASDRAAEALPCVHELVSRPLAARYHRVVGLRAFVEAHPDQAERAFAASRSIEPSYSFPPEIVPPGNPVLDHYVSLTVDTPKTLPVDRPAQGSIWLDGRESLERSISWPVVVQLTDAGGAVTATAWVEPGDPLPAYMPAPISDSGPLAPGPQPPAPPSALKRKAPWIAATAVSAAASATLFAVSRNAASTYRDPATTGEGRLDDLRGTTNGTLYASAGTALATLGFGVVAISF